MAKEEKSNAPRPSEKPKGKTYDKALAKLQVELVRLQE